MTTEEAKLIKDLRFLATVKGRNDPHTLNNLSRMFPDILPDKDVAVEWWEEIISASAARVNGTDTEWVSEHGLRSYLPSFDEPLTKDETARLRFGHSLKPIEPFVRFGERWGRGFSLYYLTRTPAGRKDMLDIFKRLRIFEYKSPSFMAATLGELSDMSKKLGPLIGYPSWKELIYWEQLGGYMDNLPPELFAKDIENWVTGDIVHESWDGTGMSEAVFLDDVEEGMYDFLHDLPNLERANYLAQTPVEWASNLTNWAGSGTSSETSEVFYYSAQGKQKRARKSKWVTALTKRPEDVVRILTEPVELEQHPKAIQKKEVKKVRAIVSSDNPLYLRMAYISSWLEVALGSSTDSMLYMNRQQQVDFWYAMGERTKARFGVNIPLDQSHFDWQQNKRMIARYIRVVGKLITKFADAKVKQYLLDCLELVRKTMIEVEYEVVIDGTPLTYTYGKGILSGWRWTALIDTVMNWGELWAGMKILQRLDIDMPVTSLNAQGDDDQLTLSSFPRAIALTLVYQLMNLEVNPGKFFISDSRDEYLRLVGEDGVVAGYPCRAINSLLWRNPVSRDPPAGVERAREQLHSWNTLLSRGSDPVMVNRLMRMDISSGNGWTKVEVDAVLRTPVAYGGLGWNREDGEWMSFTPTQVVRDYKILNTKFVGLTSAETKLERAGLKLTRGDIHQWARGLLDVVGVKTEIVGGGVTNVARHRPYRRPFAYDGGVPLTPGVSDDIRTSFGTYPIEVAVRERNWKWLREVAIPEEWRSLSDRIEVRGGRRVWVDWLLGKLPFNTPEVPYWANDVVGFDYKRVAQSALAWLLTKPVFNYSMVRRAAYTVERQVYLFLSGMPVRIGG